MRSLIIICMALIMPNLFALAASDEVMTADLRRLSGERIEVKDCAVFMPYLGAETPEVVSNLKKMGYSPQVVEDIKVEKADFVDSNGHAVIEFRTLFNKRVGYYGQKTLLLSLIGYEIHRSKKKILILKLQRLGMNEDAVASSTFTGILSQRNFSVVGFPRCQPR